MKYKKGDKVRIRPDLEKVMFDMPEMFSGVCGYAGRVATILNIDSGHFLWPDEYINVEE